MNAEGLTMNQLAERNAEYATTIAKLEAKCLALAAENAGLKAGVVRIFNYGYRHGHESTVEGNYVDIHRNDISEYHEDIVAEIAEEQTPATDAFLAEVRAQGVEMLHAVFNQAGCVCSPELHSAMNTFMLNIASKVRSGEFAVDRKGVQS